MVWFVIIGLRYGFKYGLANGLPAMPFNPVLGENGLFPPVREPKAALFEAAGGVMTSPVGPIDWADATPGIMAIPKVHAINPIGFHEREDIRMATSVETGPAKRSFALR